MAVARVSALELAAWGMLSMLPFVLDKNEILNFGAYVYWFPLVSTAVCTARINGSARTGTAAFGLIFILLLMIYLPVCLKLDFDARWSTPVSRYLLPFPSASSNPSSGRPFFSLTMLSGIYFGIQALGARLVEPGGKKYAAVKAVSRTALIASTCMSLHLLVMPSYWYATPENRLEYDVRAIVGFHLLMLLYAAFPVAIFWDLTRNPHPARETPPPSR